MFVCTRERVCERERLRGREWLVIAKESFISRPLGIRQQRHKLPPTDYQLIFINSPPLHLLIPALMTSPHSLSFSPSAAQPAGQPPSSLTRYVSHAVFIPPAAPVHEDPAGVHQRPGSYPAAWLAAWSREPLKNYTNSLWSFENKTERRRRCRAVTLPGYLLAGGRRSWPGTTIHRLWCTAFMFSSHTIVVFDFIFVLFFHLHSLSQKAEKRRPLASSALSPCLAGVDAINGTGALPSDWRNRNFQLI